MFGGLDMIKVAWINYTYRDQRGPNKKFREYLIEFNREHKNIKYIAIFPPARKSSNIIRCMEENQIEYYHCPITWFGELCSNNIAVREKATQALKKNTRQLIEILGKIQCDIVIANTTLIWEAGIAAHQLGIHLITFIRGVINPFDLKPNEINFSILRKLEKKMLALSHEIVTQSSFTAKLWGLNPEDERVTIIPLGCECSQKWNPLKLNTHEGQILNVGVLAATIEPNKNIEYIIKVAGALKDMNYTSKFTIYGSSVNPAYEKELDRQVETLEVKDYIQFHEYEDDLDQIFKTQHIIFVSSLLESFGAAVIEGMARSKPVISVKNGGPEETIIHNVTGYIIKDMDAKEGARIIAKFIDFPSKIIEFGEAGRKRWEERYDIHVILTMWAEYILRVKNKMRWDSGSKMRFSEYENILRDKPFRGETIQSIGKTKSNWLIISKLSSENPSIKVGLLSILESFTADEISYKVVKNEEAVQNLNWADVIIFVRTLEEEMIKVLHAAKQMGIQTLYYADDSLFNIPSYAHNSAHYNSLQVQTVIRKFIMNVHQVITCSPWLSEAYNKEYNIASIWMEPSVIRPKVKSNKRNNDKVIIGYAGNKDHTVELEKLKEVFKRLQDQYSQKIQYEFIGAIPSFVSELQSIWYPPLSYEEYEIVMSRRQWDIGIAFLEDTSFNNNKYINKYLEYSKFQIAGVYSNIELFNRIVKNKKNGLLSQNTPKDWLENINLLIDNVELRKKIAFNGYRHVMRKYNLHKNKHRIRKKLKNWIGYKKIKVL